METVNVAHFIVLAGAIIGAVKTSLYANKNSGRFDTLLDIAIGIFAGVMAGYHWADAYSLYMTGLISLVASVAGSIVIETIIELLPKATRKALESYIKNKAP